MGLLTDADSGGWQPDGAVMGADGSLVGSKSEARLGRRCAGGRKGLLTGSRGGLKGADSSLTGLPPAPQREAGRTLRKSLHYRGGGPGTRKRIPTRN